MAEATPIGLYRGKSHRPAAGPEFAPKSLAYDLLDN